MGEHDSSLFASGERASRVGRTGTLSLAFHGLLVLGAVLLSTRAEPVKKLEKLRLTFFDAPKAAEPVAITVEPPPSAPAVPASRSVLRSSTPHTTNAPVNGPAPSASPTIAAPCEGAACAATPAAGSVEPGTANGSAAPASAQVGPPSDGTGVPTAPMYLAAGMTKPRRLSGRDPEYLQQAQTAEVEGEVVARIEVGPDGSVRAVRLLRSLPYLGEEVTRAVRDWRFTPTLHGGQPVAIWWVQPFTFRRETH